MKKVFWLWLVSVAILGTGWHFLYNVLPCPLTALLAPVNESVWEHLKLLFFPPLLVSVFLSLRWRGAQRRFWSAVLFAALAMPAGLTAMYYTLTAGFGVKGTLPVDISLYYLAVALGAFSVYRLGRSGRADRLLGALVIGSGVFGAALVVFTIAAPPLPIFISP